MYHTYTLAAVSLTIGAALAAFISPAPITAYNLPSPLPTTPSIMVAATLPSESQSELPVASPTQGSEAPAVPANPAEAEAEPTTVPTVSNESDTIRLVPFFSQFADISDPAWKKVACGVASLAMLVNYYEPNATSANELLAAGIAADAYTENGWSHAGLIGLARAYGLSGSTVSLSHLNSSDAFSVLDEAVSEGPVMVSVHYTFEPTNPIPHLVVVTDIKNDYVYYNDPAEGRGNGFITAEKFKKAWKQRYIAIRPE